MRFSDSSAIVRLVVGEPSSAAVGSAYRQDPDILVWWGTAIECVSAIAQYERERKLTADQAEAALNNLNDLARSWEEIQPIEAVRRSAVRVLRTHSLRAADAIPLAAAPSGSEDRPDSLHFVTLDEHLGLAAQREGFQVIDPAA
ncbi:MAG: type II toxin-antitoxin system VapC family toxin [Candidatus Limnocylindria bacterium]